MPTDSSASTRAFFEAVLRADCKSLRQLVASGVNIQAAEEEEGDGCIAWAIMVRQERGDDELFECLLDLGADINRVVDGGSALGLAVMRGDPAVVEWLLDHGADPNVLCYDEGLPQTALDIAIADKWMVAEARDPQRPSNHDELIELLERHGARRATDPNAPEA